MSITLESLVGRHLLTGVDKDTTEIRKWGDEFEIAQCIRFTLGGVTYIATEDPGDGYRSTLNDLAVSDRPCAEQFAPIEVTGEMKLPSDGTTHNTIQFKSARTGLVVLEVGTDNTDDYYPWYVAGFTPENA